MQWRFLNPDRFGDLDNVKEFKLRYGVWINRNGYEQFLRPRNLAELHARMAKDAYVIRRDQCFDLPPREDIVEFVDLGPSAHTYRQMAEEMVAQLEDGSFAEAPIAIVQALRLSQITSGFVTDDQGETKRIGYEKFDKLTEILEDLIEKEAKVVVAARWRADLDLLEEYCRERKIDYYAVRGKVKRDESDKAIADFEQASGPAVMAVQPAAAALGIDLSTAAHMVWYSHTPSWVDFTQCCDRIALSRNSTTFYHIVARGTIDEVVLATLAGDGDIARAIMTRPGELLNGHPLDLDDQSRLKNIGSFQYDPSTSRRRKS
jgi:SNF2 family DNA or RNA helicase